MKINKIKYMAKKIRTVADNMEKKFTSALKKSTHEKNTLPVIVQNGVQVKMPLELVLMRASFSKIQLNIIVTVHILFIAFTVYKNISHKQYINTIKHCFIQY